jgi:hypothetical protein
MELQTSTYTQTLNILALSGIRTHDPGFRGSEDSSCLRPLGYRDRHCNNFFFHWLYSPCESWPRLSVS